MGQNKKCGNYIFNGIVTEYFTDTILNEVSVQLIIIEENKVLKEVSVDDFGKFFISAHPIDDFYLLVKKEGFYSKKIQVLGEQTPVEDFGEEDKSIPLDLRLIKKSKNHDLNYLEKLPFFIAGWNIDKGFLMYENEYNADMKEKIEIALGESKRQKGLEANLIFDGTIKDQKSGKKLSNSTNTLHFDKKLILKSETDTSGKYLLKIKPGGTITLRFEKEQYYPKIILFHTDNIELEEIGKYDYAISADINLIPKEDSYDLNFLEHTPVAIAKWIKNKGLIEFDLEYSNDILRKINLGMGKETND